MSNSALVTVIRRTHHHSGRRTHAIDRITPHCVEGQNTAASIGNYFATTPREVSSNYGIGCDGSIGLYVDEGNRSWCSSSNANDQRAVTIECASDKTHPYTMRPIVYQKLIDLCVDICRRNGKTRLLWFGDKGKTLRYTPQKHEMVLTVHRWFADKACPGDWLYSRLGDLAEQVTRRLGGKTEGAFQQQKSVSGYGDYPPGRYRVTPSVGLRLRKDPSTSAAHIKTLPAGSEIHAIEELRANVDGVWLRLEGGGYVCAQMGQSVYVEPLSAPQKACPQTHEVGTFQKYESATFTPNTTVNVRAEPTTQSEAVAKYHAGEAIRYDRVYVGAGYVWVSYIGRSGKRRYVACRTYQNGRRGEPWGSFR